MAFDPNSETDQGKAEDVREICRVKSLAEITERLKRLTDPQWTRTQADITEFAAIRNDNNEIKSGLLGANISPKKLRLEICNRIRVRLGYDELDHSSGGAAETSGSVDYSFR